MPSVSRAQQKLMAIAAHHPEEVSAKNRGVLKMSRTQLHDFASGSEKGKPGHVQTDSHIVTRHVHPYAKGGR
jgi:hypothetical protein